VERRIVLPQQLLGQEPRAAIDGHLLSGDHEQIETGQCLGRPAGMEGVSGPSQTPQPRHSGPVCADSGAELEVLPHRRLLAGSHPAGEGGGQLPVHALAEMLRLLCEGAAKSKADRRTSAGPSGVPPTRAIQRGEGGLQ